MIGIEEVIEQFETFGFDCSQEKSELAALRKCEAYVRSCARQDYARVTGCECEMCRAKDIVAELDAAKEGKQ